MAETPCPERTLKTPLPQQSPSSAREEEGRWVLMEDRRRYLDNSEAVKVGITELQQRLEVPEKSVLLFGKCLKTGDGRKWPRYFRICFGKEKKR